MVSMSQKASEKVALKAKIAAIDSLFEGPTDYLEFLYSCFPEKIKCCSCFCPELEFAADLRSARCVSCGKTMRPTANTILHNIRRPPDWVRSIFLISEGYAYSAKMYSVITDMSQSSVSGMIRKIRYVLVKPMAGIDTGISAMCAAFINKRSERTPAMDHPTSEEDSFTQEAQAKSAAEVDAIIEKALSDIFPSRAKSRESEGFRFEDEKILFKFLLEKPVTFDELLELSKLAIGKALAALSVLQMAKLVQQTIDGRFQKTVNFMGRLADTAADAAINWRHFSNFMQDTFHGVSRKYSQLYFVDYWCSLARGRLDVTSMCKLFLKSPRISGRIIKQYVTPPVVVITPKPEYHHAA